MRTKLFIILVLGFLSTFAGEIKAEEICNYSNPDDYRKCNKKSNVKIIPNYPIYSYRDINDIDYLHLSGGIQENNYINVHSNSGATYRVIYLSSPAEGKLNIVYGNKKMEFWGIRQKTPFLSKKEYFLSSEDILSWESTVVNNGYADTFNKISFVNNFGEKVDLNFYKHEFRRPGYMNIFFKDISGLRKNQTRDIKNLIGKLLSDNEKKLTIIQSIIKISKEDKENCIEADGTKYPELVVEYSELSKTINPLRAKLDLPPSSDLKPICK